MTNQGEHKDCFLNEISEPDMLLTAESKLMCRSGAVLVITNKKSLGLVDEPARVEDVFNADEYLQDANLQALVLAPHYKLQVEALKLKLNQRDELLRELSETVKSSKAENDQLRDELQAARDNIAKSELRFNETLEDLARVSLDIQMFEANLQNVIEDKTALQAELASKVTEAVELSLLNSDLKKQLRQRNPESMPSAILIDDTLGQVLIGRQFSKQLDHDIAGKVVTALRLSCYVSFVIFLSLAMMLVTSIIATAAMKDVSAGEALDALISRLI